VDSDDDMEYTEDAIDNIMIQIWTYYIWKLRFYVTGLRKNKSKVRLVKSSFDQHFP
jgi:hypothetical protein